MTRADWRLAVLFLHVLGAVVALGFSLSYGLWIGRSDATGGERRAFALQTVSWIDRRLTTPAYILQAVTGVILVLLVDLDLFRRLEVSIGIYVLLTALAITVYAPAHRRQTALAERLAAGEAVEMEYADASGRARTWRIVVTALTVTILGLMVWKPALWN